jgi:hypothetical protein
VRNCFNLKRKVKRKGERNQNMMGGKKFTNLEGHEKKGMRYRHKRDERCEGYGHHLLTGNVLVIS